MNELELGLRAVYWSRYRVRCNSDFVGGGLFFGNPKAVTAEVDN